MSNPIEQLALMIEPTRRGWAWICKCVCSRCESRYMCAMGEIRHCPITPAPLDTPEYIARVAVWAVKAGHITRDQYTEAMDELLVGTTIEIGSRMAFEYICEQIHAAATGGKA